MPALRVSEIADIRVRILITYNFVSPFQGSLFGREYSQPDGLGYDMPALRASEVADILDY